MKIKKAAKVGIIAALVLVAVAIALATSTIFTTDNLLREVTKATAAQSRDIKNILMEVGIDIDSIDVSSSAIIEGMDENWKAYDIMSKDGSKYLLILRKSDKDFTAILDADNNLIYGIVDNGVLPKYFDVE